MTLITQAKAESSLVSWIFSLCIIHYLRLCLPQEQEVEVRLHHIHYLQLMETYDPINTTPPFTHPWYL